MSTSTADATHRVENAVAPMAAPTGCAIGRLVASSRTRGTGCRASEDMPSSTGSPRPTDRHVEDALTAPPMSVLGRAISAPPGTARGREEWHFPDARRPRDRVVSGARSRTRPSTRGHILERRLSDALGGPDRRGIGHAIRTSRPAGPGVCGGTGTLRMPQRVAHRAFANAGYRTPGVTGCHMIATECEQCGGAG